MKKRRERNSKLCYRYLYLLNECVYFRRCFVCLLLQVLLCFVHVLLHLLPVYLHVAAMIGDLCGEKKDSYLEFFVPAFHFVALYRATDSLSGIINLCARLHHRLAVYDVFY